MQETLRLPFGAIAQINHLLLIAYYYTDPSGISGSTSTTLLIICDSTDLLSDF